MQQLKSFWAKHGRVIVIILAVLIAVTFTVGVWLRGSHEKSQNTPQPASSGAVKSSTQPTQPTNTTTNPSPKP
jgi:predicted negative regulator of RcsB-dependent stress response